MHRADVVWCHNRDRSDAQPAAGAEDASGDLATVRYEELLNGHGLIMRPEKS
jgi:hypothetical protein